MKRPTLIASGSLDRMLQSAEAAFERKDFEECIETMRRARRLAPSNPDVLLRLGRILGLRYEFAAAQECFEQALHIAPGKTEMLKAIVVFCQNFSKLDLSLYFLRRAVEQPDVTPDLLVALAQICELRHQLPEAGELAERALRLNPNLLTARLVQARLERQAGRFDKAETLLRSFLTEPHANTWVHVQAWYELATLLDRQGKYDEAMTSIFNAKKLQQVQADKLQYDQERFLNTCRAMQSNGFAAQLRGWLENADALSPVQRVVMLVGYARSGTTMLEQLLDAHSEIVTAEETDILVEEAFKPLGRSSPPGTDMLSVLQNAASPALLQSRTAYFQTMQMHIGHPIAGRLLLDKNPALNYMIPAFVRIFPEARFLVAIRDPRDVVLSRYMQALKVLPYTKKFVSLKETVEDYALLMNLWGTLAPLLAGRYLEVRYEDMVEDLESVARRTLDFLEVPWEAQVLKFNEHARRKTVRTPSTADVTQPVYKRAVGRWRNYQKYLEPHLEKLEPFVKAFGYE